MNNNPINYWSLWLEKLKLAAKQGYDDCIEMVWNEEMKEVLRAAKPE